MESAGSGPGGVEDAFGVESYRLDKDWVGSHRASTSMTRFIEREPVAREMPREEDNAEEESNSGNRESEGSYARQLRARNWDAFAVNPGGLDRTLPGRERLPEAGNSGSLSGVDESSISERDAAERPSLRPRFGTGVGMDAAGRDSSWRFRSGERLTARDFATPSDAALSASKESGSGDPVNLFPDLTRQALNPVTASSVVPGGPMSRPIGPLDAEVGRPANRLRSRFSDSTGTGLGEGPAAASVAETQVGTSSKVFKSRVLLEMPTRRF
jgi:hypothetical protein